MILRDFVAKKIEEVETQLGRRGLVEISDVMEAVNLAYTREGGKREEDTGSTETDDVTTGQTVMCHIGEEQVVPLDDVMGKSLPDCKVRREKL